MSSPAGLARNLRVPRFAEQAAERARLVVVPRVRRRAPRLPFAMLVGLVLLSGVVGLLMFNTSLQRTSFVISERSTQAEGLHAEVQQLRLQLDELRDPQALGIQALRMGMRPPDAPAFVQLGQGMVAGTAATSTCVNCFRVATPDAAKPQQLRPAPVIVRPTNSGAGKPAGADGAATRDGGGAGGKKNQDRSSATANG